jgi:predicted DNA-binding transcriptional regulator AlpA
MIIIKGIQMRKKNKLITSVEACTLMDNMSIDTFLILERDEAMPPPIKVGLGRRWYKNEILEWYEDAKEHL